MKRRKFLEFISSEKTSTLIPVDLIRHIRRTYESGSSMKEKYRVKLTLTNGDDVFATFLTEELQKAFYESLKNQL